MIVSVTTLIDRVRDSDVLTADLFEEAREALGCTRDVESDGWLSWVEMGATESAVIALTRRVFPDMVWTMMSGPPIGRNEIEVALASLNSLSWEVEGIAVRGDLALLAATLQASAVRRGSA